MGVSRSSALTLGSLSGGVVGTSWKVVVDPAGRSDEELVVTKTFIHLNEVTREAKVHGALWGAIGAIGENLGGAAHVARVRLRFEL